MFKVSCLKCHVTSFNRLSSFLSHQSSVMWYHVMFTWYHVMFMWYIGRTTTGPKGSHFHVIWPCYRWSDLGPVVRRPAAPNCKPCNYKGWLNSMMIRLSKYKTNWSQFWRKDLKWKTKESRDPMTLTEWSEISWWCTRTNNRTYSELKLYTIKAAASSNSPINWWTSLLLTNLYIIIF